MELWLSEHACNIERQTAQEFCPCNIIKKRLRYFFHDHTCNCTVYRRIGFSLIFLNPVTKKKNTIRQRRLNKKLWPFWYETSLSLVLIPLVDTGASPSWRHASPASAATAATKPVVWPSAATRGSRTVTKDPAGSGGRLCRRLDPGDNILDLLSCGIGLWVSAWAVELASRGTATSP